MRIQNDALKAYFVSHIPLCLTSNYNHYNPDKKEEVNKVPIYAETLYNVCHLLPFALFRFSLEDNYPVSYASDRLYELLCHKNSDILSSLSQIVLPQDWQVVQKELQENLQENPSHFQLHFRGDCKDGSTKWLLAQCARTSEEPGFVTVIVVDITKQKEMEHALRENEELYRIAFENTHNTINIFDIEKQCLYQRQQIDPAFNIPAVNFPSVLAKSGFAAPDNLSVYLNFFDDMTKGIPHGEALLHLLHSDGTYHWYDSKYTLRYTDAGKPSQGILTYIDVTEQQAKEIAFRKWNAYFSMQRKNSLAYCEYNLTRDVFQCLEDNSHFMPNGSLSLQEFVEFMKQNIAEEDSTAFVNAFRREQMILQYYEDGGEMEIEYRWKSDSGFVWVSNIIQLITDPATDDIKAFILIKNVDQAKQELAQLQNQAECDGLTGLLNRTYFTKYVTTFLEQSAGVNHAFIMLDVDHFKEVNDSFGHQFGDKILKEAAASISKCLRRLDLFGRMGGDEFAIFLPDLSSIEAAERRLSQICRAASKTYANEIQITFSMGLAFYPQNGSTFQELYQQADQALYNAKRNGRNQFVISKL